jgi:hypothetical protein
LGNPRFIKHFQIGPRVRTLSLWLQSGRKAAVGSEERELQTETFDLESEVIWSAPEERSGDGALDVN